jgi:hypothetical protein
MSNKKKHKKTHKTIHTSTTCGSKTCPKQNARVPPVRLEKLGISAELEQEKKGLKTK